MKYSKKKKEFFFPKKIHLAGASMVRITAATCESLSRVVVVDQRMAPDRCGWFLTHLCHGPLL
jgi:hypothetical protein